MTTASRSLLVTGGAGYIGSQLVAELAADPGELETIVSFDVRSTPEADRLPGVHYAAGDIRGVQVGDLVQQHGVDTVVHLAAIVTPGPEHTREVLYQVDVGGTRCVLEACLAAGVRRLIVTSSGAAYGYHADNPQPLHENDALRGNPEFAYSDHKRIVEELLARHRKANPELEQLIFRPGTILGATTRNQITAIFDKPVVTGLSGSDSPFVLIWDEDVVGSIIKGIREQATGIYNLAGDGVLTLREIAKLLGKPYLALPVGAVRGALGIMKKLRVGQYGPEHVNFLRYRPVLCNRALKEDFGYVPRKSTREVFELFLKERRAS
jgi:UDP-glucose 4-epimerase